MGLGTKDILKLLQRIDFQIHHVENYILRLVGLDRENIFRSSRGDVSVHTVPHVDDILGIDLDVLEGNSKHSVHFLFF